MGDHADDAVNMCFDNDDFSLGSYDRKRYPPMPLPIRKPVQAEPASPSIKIVSYKDGAESLEGAAGMVIAIRDRIVELGGKLPPSLNFSINCLREKLRNPCD